MSLRGDSLRTACTGAEITLPFRPLLESWDRSDAPSQVRLAEYRALVAALAAPALAELAPPLVLGFYVAGREDVARGCDLDNFLTPVVKALGGGELFSLVWAERGSANERPRLTLLETKAARHETLARPAQVSTRLSVGAARPEWKAALATAVGRHGSAGRPGPIELGLRFGVFPRRNWVTLWKPAIDALGGVLGESDRPWHPRDDRISLLVLERVLRPELEWHVQIDVWWSEP
jgi:hypothetical protein